MGSSRRRGLAISQRQPDQSPRNGSLGVLSVGGVSQVHLTDRTYQGTPTEVLIVRTNSASLCAHAPLSSLPVEWAGAAAGKPRCG